jgi:hypothetical protein
MDADGVLELDGKFLHGGGDFGRLLAERFHHALGHLGFVADQFSRGHDEGKMVIDVVAQGAKLLIQLFNFVRAQTDWLDGHSHWPKHGHKEGWKSSCFAIDFTGCAEKMVPWRESDCGRPAAIHPKQIRASCPLAILRCHLALAFPSAIRNCPSAFKNYAF